MASDAARKARDYRRRLRARGLRPVRLLVPDLRDPSVAARLRGQLRKLRDHPGEDEIGRLLEANLAEIDGWSG